MEKITDYGIYTDGMRKSMTDKTWFLMKCGVVFVPKCFLPNERRRK